jgi:hypothetical protein
MNLSPTRPTIANSATMQSRNVLQVETGYDAYPPSTPGSQQTVDTFLTYTPLVRLRLDFGWSAFNHQQAGADSTNGIGTIQIGGKIELKKEHIIALHRQLGFSMKPNYLLLPSRSSRAMASRQFFS